MGIFFAYSKQSEVVILHNVINETEDVLEIRSTPSPLDQAATEEVTEKLLHSK